MTKNDAIEQMVEWIDGAQVFLLAEKLGIIYDNYWSGDEYHEVCERLKVDVMDAIQELE